MKYSTSNLYRPVFAGSLLLGSLIMAGCAGNSVKPVSSPLSPVATKPDVIQLQTINTSNTSMPKNETKQELNMVDSNETAEKFPQIDISEKAQPDKIRFYFGFDKAKLEPADIEILRQHARFMIDNPGLILQISGHTDKTGPREYNEYLSKQRADTVAGILIAEGVPESQLVIKARADEEPLLNVTEAYKNRRVEIEYQELNLVSSQ